MTLNVPRLRRTVRRALAGKSPSMADVAERSWTVCPAASSTAAPALFPDGALDKILKLSPYRVREGEDALIHGGPVALKATVGHVLRDVDIVRGHVHCGPMVWVEGMGDAPWWLPPMPAEPVLPKANLVSTASGTEFFGCLLLDDFPLELLSEDPSLNVSLLAKPSGHEAGYRELLGLVPKVTVQRTRVREMTWFIDPAYNESKSARYRALRANLRQHVGPSACSGRLYIRRGLAGQRRVMENEAELEAVLLQHGFTVIDPMKLSALEIARLSLDAKVVVSIEGSQISHAQFSMADEASLIVIQPPDRFCMQYKEFTDALDMRFGFVVGTPGTEGFRVDIDELLRLVDQMGSMHP